MKTGASDIFYRQKSAAGKTAQSRKSANGFVADWHFFVRRLQDRLMQQSDMEAAQRINRYILPEFYFQGWDAEQNFYDQFSERLKKAQKELA